MGIWRIGAHRSGDNLTPLCNQWSRPLLVGQEYSLRPGHMGCTGDQAGTFIQSVVLFCSKNTHNINQSQIKSQTIGGLVHIFWCIRRGCDCRLQSERREHLQICSSSLRLRSTLINQHKWIRVAHRTKTEPKSEQMSWPTPPCLQQLWEIVSWPDGGINVLSHCSYSNITMSLLINIVNAGVLISCHHLYVEPREEAAAVLQMSNIMETVMAVRLLERQTFQLLSQVTLSSNFFFYTSSLIFKICQTGAGRYNFLFLCISKVQKCA